MMLPRLKKPSNVKETTTYLDLLEKSKHHSWIFASAAISLDGSLNAGSWLKPFSGELDSMLYRKLRSKADAVIIGANTVRASEKSAGIDHPSFNNTPVILSNSLQFSKNTAFLLQKKKGYIYTKEQTNPNKIKNLKKNNSLLEIKPGNWTAESILKDLLKTKDYKRIMIDGGGAVYPYFSNFIEDWFLTTVPAFAENNQPSFWDLQQLSSIEQKQTCKNELEIVYSFQEGNRFFSQFKNNSKINLDKS